MTQSAPERGGPGDTAQRETAIEELSLDEPWRLGGRRSRVLVAVDELRPAEPGTDEVRLGRDRPAARGEPDGSGRRQRNRARAGRPRRAGSAEAPGFPPDLPARGELYVPAHHRHTLGTGYRPLVARLEPGAAPVGCAACQPAQ